MSIPPQGNSATAIVEAGTAVAGATANTVLYVDAAGLLASEAAFTYDESTDTLTALNIVASTTFKASNLTSGRVVFATTGGQLTDDADMTFATDTLTVAKLTVSTGPILASGATTAATGIIVGASGYSIFKNSNNIEIDANAGFRLAILGNTAEIVMPSTSIFGWASGTTLNNADAALVRDAANVVAQRNGTNAQEKRIYGTYTDASNFVYGATRVNKVSVTCAAGATVVATGAIPARTGGFVIGIATKVSTAIGTGSGTTGYTVGDGSDADRWGSVTGTATTTATDRDSYTAAAQPAFSTSAADITLTATGGNFDGTGVIDVYVFYSDVQAD